MNNTKTKMRKKWYKCKKCALSFSCDKHDVAFSYLYKAVAIIVFFLAVIIVLIGVLITDTNSSQVRYNNFLF